MSSPQNMPLNITPVILAGGEGRRLRPLTSPSRPKPFLKFGSKYSLLQHTLLRVSTKHFAPPFIVLHNKYRDRGQYELGGVGLGDSELQSAETQNTNRQGRIICEPENRSTAAAIALAAFALQGHNTVMAVMPSDHYIEDAGALRTALIEAAGNQSLTHIGVRPGSMDTRYGYIKAQSGAVKRFVEKPSPAKARALLAQGDCYWNTGIFTCCPVFFLGALECYAPEIFIAVKAAYEHRTLEGACIYPNAQLYHEVPSLPVDYAVMENLENSKLVVLETAWHDIGCWPSLLNVKFSQLIRKKGRIRANG